MPFQRRLIAAAAAAIATTPAAAETQEPVVVTATRTAETVDSTLAPVTVLTREDIEQSQAADLPELLANRTGIQISHNGGRGKSSSLFLRGTNSDHTLFLIDGQRVGSATLGGAAFQDIPPEIIERVEVVRGPRASLYGADAIGGVVNIITRQGETAHLRVGGGRYNTREASMGVGIQEGNSRLRMDASFASTDGFDAKTDQANGNDDADGYDNRSLNLHAGHDFGPLELGLDYYRTDAENEYDPFAGGNSYQESIRDAGHLNIAFSPASVWQSEVSIGQNRDDQDTFSDGAFSSTFTTERTTAHWQNDLTISGRQMLTAGLDYYEDSVEESTTEFAETRRYNRAGYLQYQWMGQRLDFQVSGRWDDNEAYGEQTTGQAALGWRLNESARLIASHGTAFKAPTFNDLYYPGFGGLYAGNPDLQAEESRTTDFGIRLRQGAARVAVTAFRTEVDQLIDYTDDFSQTTNVNEARIHGVETEVGLTGEEWDLDLSITSLDTENKETGESLDRRADLTWRVEGERRVGDWRFGGGLEHQGSRSDGTATLGAYTLARVRAAWDITEQFTVRSRIENLTDADYQLADGYNTAGKSAYGEVVWRLR
ncbi:vitamin B12 transporter [Thiohalospira halophila DSM 15071]|uniref:Vitamin B12 transporter n=1 Tax=Thiohalospira halophila DSM 15071 TaxID=1123397 RepID=A0A1I1QGX6_9GAMM|nr:TonB-dependent receptor [Thiohalospira halophila]SFD17370.1 vitamin B12 transporter [Thiohalospira halophila DSM 15071]